MISSFTSGMNSRKWPSPSRIGCPTRRRTSAAVMPCSVVVIAVPLVPGGPSVAPWLSPDATCIVQVASLPSAAGGPGRRQGAAVGKDDVRPIRSILFVGGDDGEQLRASTGFGADAVICDLEEPREPFSDAQRVAAGADVGAFLRTLPGSDVRTQYFVRVRGPHTGLMFRDLAPVVCEGLTGVLVPKIDGRDDVIAADAVLTAAEVEAGLEPGTIALYPILETAEALRHAYEIAAASRAGRLHGRRASPASATSTRRSATAGPPRAPRRSSSARRC